MGRRYKQRQTELSTAGAPQAIRLYVAHEEQTDQTLDWLRMLVQLCNSVGDARVGPAPEDAPPAAARPDEDWARLVQQGLIAPEAAEPMVGESSHAVRYLVTAAGARIVKQLAATARSLLDGDARPLWDRRHRELSFAGVPIVRFSRRSQNQEPILEEFQRQGWPERIDDPLPAADGIPSPARLHDAIKCLNRRLGPQAPLRFHGDGTGRGVRWDRSGPAPG